MDKSVSLKYGTEVVDIEIKGAKSIEFLNPDPMPEIEDVNEAFRACVEDGAIASAPLREKISADDEITIVVSDITRSWMHQGDIVTLLGHYLHDTCDVPFENICVLIAPLCVPLLVSSLKKVDVSAMSAEMRGFELRGYKSGYKEYPFAARDVVTVLVLVALIVAVVVFKTVL